MEDPNHTAKLTPISRAAGRQGLCGILFIEGFSVCGVEFHLHSLLKVQPWPTTSKFLFTFSHDKPGEMADVLEQNNFKMIVWANPVFEWRNQYKQMEKPYTAALRTACERVNTALKAAVKDKGSTLVLFCAEKASCIYKDMFGASWTEGEYVRTDAFQTQAAAQVLPAGAPAVINAKAILLNGVPPTEAWYSTTPDSKNNSLLPRPGLGPNQASIAAVQAGAGRVVYVGDVNAETETCHVVQQLAYALFRGQEQLGCTWYCQQPAEGQQLSRCGQCMQVFYCSQECQRAHWREHKKVCKEIAATVQSGKF